MNLIGRFKGVVDSMIYLFVGPFTVIGTVPLLLMDFDASLGLARWSSETASSTGYLIMNLGAALALWCTWLMHRHGGTPIPSAPASQIVRSGPYAMVRHPMMHSLLIVGVGELLVTGSLFMLLWIAVAMRAGVQFIANYEEPVLVARYGSAYLAYCEAVPRWMPKWSDNR
ncbi:MAG: hypothetical protein AUJ57_03165 [Zetaproteobacteria bacterium CG1_02_53_45]|nr:MAG: hypothetical protein AUJ57_03165 [Zetaproteobacteria bacterium CG1_02_53_45]